MARNTFDGGIPKEAADLAEGDGFTCNPAKAPVHVHDFQATIMHLLGIDHEKFTFRFQGRQFRLTDVHGEVVNGLLA